MAGIEINQDNNTLIKARNFLWEIGSSVAGFTLFLGLVLMVWMVLSVSALSVSKAYETTPSEIIAVFPKNFPPYYDTDAQGNPHGYAIEVLDEVAKRTGLNIHYEAKESWMEVFAAIKSGQAHIIPNLGITDERKDFAVFTVPMDSFRISLFVRKEGSKITSLSGLSNQTVGVVRNNVGVKLISRWKNVKKKIFNYFPEALDALIANDIDALIYPERVTWNYARSRGIEEIIKTVGRPLSEVSRGIAVRKDLLDLHQALDTALRMFLDTSDFEIIYRKWHEGSSDPQFIKTDWWPSIALLTVLTVTLIAFFFAIKMWATLKSSLRLRTIDIGDQSGSKRILLLILVMASVTFIVTGIVIVVLYEAAVTEQGKRLSEAAKSQARLIESIARFNLEYNGNYSGGAIPATLSIIKDSLTSLTGTNELTLARREEGNILFLLRQKASRRYEPASIPFTSPLAEPMRRALLGQSGTMIGLDYRNQRVLAAHEPIAVIDFGIVYKIDMAEIRTPFIRAALTAAFLSFLVIILGAIVFIRVGEPMVREIREMARRFKDIFDSSAVSIWDEDFSFLCNEFERLRSVGITNLRSYLKENENEALRLSHLVRVNHVNPATLQLYGASSVEELRGSIDKIFSPTSIEIFIDELCAVWDRKEHFRAETSQRTLDGRDISVIISMFIPKDKEMFKNVPVSMIDITEERRVVEKLRINEARIQDMNIELEQKINERTIQLQNINKELEAFTYSVSHDLRAPLRAINGFSEALAEDYGELFEGEAKKYLQYLREGSQEMARLIDDLLKLSRSTRGEMEVTQVNVSEIASKIIDDLKKLNPDRNVTIYIEPNVVVQADNRLLSTALQNLLDNAWKFTSKKSKAIIEFGANRQNGRLVCHVRDNGAGFNQKYADKLFKPFQRLHSQGEFEGTGVGLSTVQRIIERHGGRCWAESKVEEGACFYFDLEAGETS